MLLQPASEISAELRNPTSWQAQSSALRSLKNDIIGNEQRKHFWIKAGLTSWLSRVLSAPDTTDPDCHQARYQAVIIVGSIAAAGPAYLPSLEAYAIYASLIRALDYYPSSLSLAALRALNNVADACTTRIAEGCADQAFAQSIYSDVALERLSAIISDGDSSPETGRHASLAALLIAKTCNTEGRKERAFNFGILHGCIGALPRHLLNVHAANATAITSATDFQKYGDGVQALRAYLRTIATIVNGHADRTTAYINVAAPLFAHAEKEIAAKSGNAAGRQRARTNQNQGYSTALEVSRNETSDAATAIPSLIRGYTYLIRQLELGVTRLLAIWNVTLILQSAIQEKDAYRIVSRKFIPDLMDMLDHIVADGSTKKRGSTTTSIPAADVPSIKEDMPRVLGLLAGPDEDFQDDVIEAHSVAKLGEILRSVHNLSALEKAKSFWSPAPELTDSMDESDNTPGQDLGPPGVSAEIRHRWIVCESIFKAVAALANHKDSYRKAIMDEKVMPILIECLVPLDLSSIDVENSVVGEGIDWKKLGYPKHVVIAACEAIKNLSRSVSTLRESLQGLDLTAPLVTLLKHRDVEIKNAATKVICNVVLEFAPMRQSAEEAGVLVVLGKQARYYDDNLRLNSLWALKHFVHSAPSDVKARALNVIGVEYLWSLIENIPTTLNASANGHNYITVKDHPLGSANALGQKVNILNAVEPSQPSRSNTNDEEDEPDEIDIITETSLEMPRSTFTASPRNGTVSIVMEAQIQEQALGFVRNIVNGTDTPDMVNHLADKWGIANLFNLFSRILSASKRTSSSSSRRHSRSTLTNTANDTNPATRISLAVLYIICNMTGSNPHHRQVLISQSELWQLILPFFNDAHPEIRQCCVFMVINLTWIDDAQDRLNCRARAFELRKMGVLERLQSLEDDESQDVKERTKTAMFQMTELLRP